MGEDVGLFLNKHYAVSVGMWTVVCRRKLLLICCHKIVATQFENFLKGYGKIPKESYFVLRIDIDPFIEITVFQESNIRRKHE